MEYGPELSRIYVGDVMVKELRVDEGRGNGGCDEGRD